MFLSAQKKRLIEYPQHVFWFKNKKIIFLLRTLNLSPGTRITMPP